METREFSTLPSSQSDQASNVVKQMQPVPTSGGRDLAQDLVWQRDPDCSKDPGPGNSVFVSPGQPVNQSSVRFPNSSGATVQPQLSPPYSYQVPPTITRSSPSGDDIQVSGGVVPTFQQPNSYSGMRPQNIVQYVTVTNTQHVVMDTDGNQIQQNPVMHQNIPFAGYPMQQNMVPVQFSGNSSVQYVNMQPPATVNPQLNYTPRLVPYNPQAVPLQTPPAGSTQFTPPRPANLNVTVASQHVQNTGNLSTATAGTQVTSPMTANATGQSPTGVVSPGSESVKSPTYVYMCNKCNYVTPYRSSFKTHYSSHIQYKPYQCAYCDHQTIMKQPMQKHVKMKHVIEDSEGFTYESDSKKENIIDFFCNQCRSTMNMEEAKTYLAKFEGSHEKLKPGPAKRKISKEFVNEEKDDQPVSPSKKKKRFSFSENQSEEGDQNVTGKLAKSPISPRKLTHWKQDVTRFPDKKASYTDADGNVKRKTFIGPQKKFKGFGIPKKHLPKNFFCNYCEFGSFTRYGVQKHCDWRHKEKRMNCTKCSYFTYFEEELEKHIKNNECENENAQFPAKHERNKSPKKTIVKQKAKPEETKTLVSDGLSEEASDDSNDDIQLNCPHCNFVSSPFALKRHLFFYHKECDWRCKLCSFISNSKKEVVRHSSKAHPDSQPNIVQTFADISSLLPGDASEQEKGTPPEKDISENVKVISKHRLIDRDYIKTSKKRLVLGKKRVSKIVGGGESGTEDQLQVTKVLGMDKKGVNTKRGRKKEEKEVQDQSSFIVRPKKLKIATIGFSCVYCTYAAPLRHQLRLHCYEKHTKHPACLMEFVNCETALLEEQVNFARDMTEEKKSVDTEIDNLKDTGEKTSDSMVEKEQNVEEKTGDQKSCDQSEIELSGAEDKESQSNEFSKMEVEMVNTENKLTNKSPINNDQGNTDENKDKNESKNSQENTDVTSKDEDEQEKEVLSCMENILADITHQEQVQGKNNSLDSKSDNSVLPDKINGHKFSNPFSTLIVQLNSTEIKVKDAFEGTLDDVDIYLEKMGVRTLNMDSLTPKQFDIFMRKFGSSLQPITV